MRRAPAMRAHSSRGVPMRTRQPRPPLPRRPRAEAAQAGTFNCAPLLLHAFETDDDMHLITERTLHEGHPIVAALDREPCLTAAAHFALHALAFRPFLK